MSALSMAKAEREAFLAGRHVGVLAIDGPAGRPPLTCPVWYAYEPGGDVVFIVDGSSMKLHRLLIQGMASLCAQSEDLPYQYVTVEGWVTAERTVDPDQRAALANRYLPPDLADLYLASTADNVPQLVTVRLTPERWLTTDFGKQWPLP